MRAVGIVRQSKGSEDALSPAEQRDRIAEHCEREGFDLLRVHEEIDVSGGTPLTRRDGLRSAVEAVETGGADVVLVAYFDRLVRSLRVQDEVVSRVEAAGGRVVAVDFGEITGRTAAQWLSGTMIGAVSEYYRRSVRERVGEAQARAVAAGVAPFPHVPPGYLRSPEKRLEPDPQSAGVVAEAFRMRADGASVVAVRTFLAEHGIRRSYHAVHSLLASRVVLGEIRFGPHVNPSAHEPIVDRDTWVAVQKMSGTRGAQAKSERLLARLGVLRCASCGCRMVITVQTKRGRRYPTYRCPTTVDCDQRVSVSAKLVENYAVGLVKDALAELRGRASVDSEVRGAELALEDAQSRLDAAIRAFGEIGEEAAALDRLRELRDSRDAARSRLDHLGRLHLARTVSVADWDLFTLEERRRLVRETVEWIRVAPGRGVGRLSAKLLV